MKKRRLFARICALLMVCVILSPFVPVVYAADGDDITQDQAVEYIRSLEGLCIDVDDGEYTDVDLAMQYFKEVGGRQIVSLEYICGGTGAYCYADPVSDGAIPDGWVRKYYSDGYVPQPGDVAVWDKNQGVAGDEGHVALVISVVADGAGYSIKYVEQINGSGQPASVTEDYLDAGNPTCYIVPTFNQIFTMEEILAADARFNVLVLDAASSVNFVFSEDNVYSSNNSIDEVKSAGESFLDSITEYRNNYVAIVSYSDEAEIVTDFTNDTQVLKSAINDVYETGGRSNPAAGLAKAQELLSSVTNENAIKNVIMCTTGLADEGDYSYEGEYSPNDDRVPETWVNDDTGIELYAMANVAVKTADDIKNSGVSIYVIGVFNPIESALPADGQTLANFFRITAEDMASGSECFFSSENTDGLKDIFGQVEEHIDEVQEIRIYVKGTKDTAADYEAKDEHGVYIPFNLSFKSLIYSSESTRYNPQLAYMLMALAYSAYNANGSGNKNTLDDCNIYYSYKSMGLDEDDIKLYNYYKKISDPEYGEDNVGFAFGRSTLPNGKKLVVVSVRGSVGAITSRSSDWKSNFNLGEVAPGTYYHSGFKSAADKVMNELDGYSGGFDKDTVYVVTGHSRGAAVANIVSKLLVDKGISQDNVFDYNFACPDVARDASGVWNKDGKYNNIMNINDCSDPIAWVPGVAGNIIGDFIGKNKGISNLISAINDLRKNGFSDDFNWKNLVSAWGKYGNTYWFSNDWRNIGALLLKMDSHQQENYLGYLSKLKPQSEFKGTEDAVIRQLCADAASKLSIIGFFCPVDVELVDSDGNLLAAVQGDEIRYGEGVDIGDIIVITMGDRKEFLINGHDNVKVNFVGTDSGEMTYFYAHVDLASQQLSGGDGYTNVELSKGKTYVSDLDLNNMEETRLYETDSNGDVVAEIAKDGAVLDTSVDSATSSDDDDPLFSFSKWKENVGWDVSDAQLRAMIVVIAIFVIIVIFIGLTMM